MSRNGRRVDHLLVGGGVAAVSCATELRAIGSGGSITIVGREPHPPYFRPMMTKSYLQGTELRDDALLRPAHWWTQNDIELLTGTSVTEIDLDERRARLSNGEEVCFDQALFATGATPRRLGVEGGDLDGIHALGTITDADALRHELANAEDIVTIGGSYVACEAAATLRAQGRRCTIVMLEDHPLEQSFGSTAGQYLRAALETHGVTVLGRQSLDRYEGASGHVRTVHTKGGRSVRADLVVVGVGVQPNVAIAHSAGLRLGQTGGVYTDRFLRSSHETVFCAGDVCEYDSVLHRRRLRLEFQHAAAEQGRTAARNMLGEQQAHSAVPYSTAEFADWVSLEFVGAPTSWDEEIVRGSMADGEFTVWYLDSRCLVGALIVGRPHDLDHAWRLIASRAELGEHRALLSDPDSDLSPVTGVPL